MFRKYLKRVSVCNFGLSFEEMSTQFIRDQIALYPHLRHEYDALDDLYSQKYDPPFSLLILIPLLGFGINYQLP